MAECHPVGFRWVMEAKNRGATVIHVDPRFSRTSAVSDLHVPIRAGTDIAFLGEPSSIWRRGRSHLPHEMYATSAATPQAVSEIRSRFRAVAQETGGSRILEKTPANSLRLGFVLAAFPDARIVHIVRDGRDVAVSVRKKLEGDPLQPSERGDRAGGLAALAAATLLAACPGGGKEGVKTPQPDNLTKVSLQDVGLESASLDRSADACTDFYQFACGGWLAANDIPADRARWAHRPDTETCSGTGRR